ncbi:MAG: preprotein translocase subunit SecG [Myxococcales bacterium]|nr:preprotein translocase subunit SecG [Myxococcales bacterium]
MTTFLTIIHVILCLFLIAVVLLQSGRSGGMGVLSGAASQQVFGGRGAGNFLQRLTSIVAFMFMFTCATLGFIASSTRDRGLARSEQQSTTVAVGGQRDGGADGSAAADSGRASAPVIDLNTTSIAPAADAAATEAAEGGAAAPAAEPAGDAAAPSGDR